MELQKKAEKSGEKSKKRLFILPKNELERVERLLKRSVDKEAGKLALQDISEDNPDGRKFRNHISYPVH